MASMPRTVQATERNYSYVKIEPIAIIEAIRKWRHYLARQHFYIIAD